MLGMGAGPASRSAGLKSTSRIKPHDIPGLSASKLGQGTAREDSPGQGNPCGQR